MVIFHSYVSLPEGIEPETIEVDKPTEKTCSKPKRNLHEWIPLPAASDSGEP